MRLARQRYGQADANADASVWRARAELARRKSIAVTGAVSADELTAARVAVKQAQVARDRSAAARLEKAKLDRARTVIRAPIDGIVTNRQMQVEQRIAAGTPIMVIVPIATAYIEASFKESQFGDIRNGQPIELTSDYYGGDVVHRGGVVGIADGTGAAFSLIPAQNATGN